MADSDLGKWSKALILKIHVITGWIVPEAELMNILTDQLRKKLVESYHTCNPDEIEYAFRNYGTSVKDWGKAMNLSLMDEVMQPYLSKRFELSRLEEQVKTPPQLNTPQITPEAAEAVRKEFVNDLYNEYLRGALKPDYIPSYLFLFLEEQNKISITVPQKKAIYERGRSYYLKLKSDESRPIGSLLNNTSDEDGEMIKRIARQFAIYEYFEQEKSKGLTKIF